MLRKTVAWIWLLVSLYAVAATCDQRNLARAAWERLAASHPFLDGRHPLIAAALSRDGVQIHRLQVAGLTRESADALCAALSASGDACVIEPPAGRRPR